MSELTNKQPKKMQIPKFFFARNLPISYQKLDSESLETLENCLRTRTLPCGSRCLRSDTVILAEIVEAKRKNLYIALPKQFPVTPSQESMETSSSSDDSFEDTRFWYKRVYFGSDHESSIEKSPKTENIYVPESEESTVSESDSEMDSDSPLVLIHGVHTPYSPDPESDELEVTSTYQQEPVQQMDQETQIYQGPNGLYPTIELAIAAYHESW